MPLRRWIAPVHRPSPVEVRLPFWNEVAVEVRDVAVGVGENRVVGGVGVELHRLAERLVAPCLGARVRLNQRFYRLLHQADARPFAIGASNDRTVVRVVNRESLLRYSG